MSINNYLIFILLIESFISLIFRWATNLNGNLQRIVFSLRELKIRNNNNDNDNEMYFKQEWKSKKNQKKKKETREEKRICEQEQWKPCQFGIWEGKL